MPKSDLKLGSAAPSLATVKADFQKDLREIGPYSIVRPIGSGGMSRVFLAKDPRSGQDVAVKVLRPEMLERPNVVRRFQSEFRSTRKLCHPSLVRAIEFNQDQGLPYLVLEYVEGRSLFEIIRERLRLPEQEALPIIRQTAEGLQVAHRLNLVHRDIKPGNILVSSDGVAKLSDLGLAKDLMSADAITRSGASLGTLHYMAPEQFLDARKADSRSDLYSLGVTLYHLVTGRLPFSGGQLTMLKKKKANQFTPPRDIVPTLSAGTQQLLMRALRGDPAERHPTCGEFLSDLDVAINNSSQIDAKSLCSSPDNRRAETRFPTLLRGTCAMLMDPSKDSWRGHVVDISAGGAHIVVDRRFEIGTLLAVDVDDEQLDETISFTIRISWVRPGAEKNSWSIGGRFHRRMPPSELEKLLKREIHTVVLQVN
jgi:serine/threonine protein kinase